MKFSKLFQNIVNSNTEKDSDLYKSNGKWTVHWQNSSSTAEIDVKDNKWELFGESFAIKVNGSTNKLEFTWPGHGVIQTAESVQYDQIKWTTTDTNCKSVVWNRIK